MAHVVEPDGSHTIVVKVPAHLAEWEAPAFNPAPSVFRGQTWDQIQPPPRKSRR